MQRTSVQCIYLYNFRGITRSIIYFNLTTETWNLRSLIDKDLYLECESDHPLGTCEWTVIADRALCEKESMETAKLTLSACYPGMYTCDSGHCVPIDQRCDIDFDCEDKSDELLCSTIAAGGDYAKELLPVQASRDPVPVYINISIFAFPKIDTIGKLISGHFF